MIGDPLLQGLSSAAGVGGLAFLLLHFAFYGREEAEIDVPRLIAVGLGAAGDVAERRAYRGRRRGTGDRVPPDLGGGEAAGAQTHGRRSYITFPHWTSAARTGKR